MTEVINDVITADEASVKAAAWYLCHVGHSKAAVALLALPLGGKPPRNPRMPRVAA